MLSARSNCTVSVSSNWLLGPKTPPSWPAACRAESADRRQDQDDQPPRGLVHFRPNGVAMANQSSAENMDRIPPGFALTAQRGAARGTVPFSRRIRLFETPRSGRAKIGTVPCRGHEPPPPGDRGAVPGGTWQRLVEWVSWAACLEARLVWGPLPAGRHDSLTIVFVATAGSYCLFLKYKPWPDLWKAGTPRTQVGKRGGL